MQNLGRKCTVLHCWEMPDNPLPSWAVCWAQMNQKSQTRLVCSIPLQETKHSTVLQMILIHEVWNKRPHSSVTPYRPTLNTTFLSTIIVPPLNFPIMWAQWQYRENSSVEFCSRLILINKLKNLLEKGLSSEVEKFAEDTHLLNVGSVRAERIELQMGLRLNDWVIKWQRKSSAEKCEMMYTGKSVLGFSNKLWALSCLLPVRSEVWDCDRQFHKKH